MLKHQFIGLHLFYPKCMIWWLAIILNFNLSLCTTLSFPRHRRISFGDIFFPLCLPFYRRSITWERFCSESSFVNHFEFICHRSRLNMVVSFTCQFTEIYSPFLKLNGCSCDASVSSDPVWFGSKQGRGVLFSFPELGPWT